MRERGQASIEFIFLISIAMLFISTVVLPSLEVSKIAAEDVTQLAQARMAAEKLANTIDSVAAASGETKQTVTLFVPARGTVKCIWCDPSNTLIPCEFPVVAPHIPNAIGLDFLLVNASQNPVLHYTLPPCTVTGGINTCTKSFGTAKDFTCGSGTTIGDPAFATSITAEISVVKNASGAINVTLP